MKYEGRLSKPIVRKKLGLLAPEEAFELDYKRVVDEMFGKLPELFAAHAVPDGNWAALAIELAKEHVPGFRVVNPAGRKTEWEVTDKAELRVDVDAEIEQSGLSVIEAIKVTIRRPAWAAKTKPMKLDAIRKHYDAADPRWVRIVEDARRWESIQSDN